MSSVITPWPSPTDIMMAYLEAFANTFQAETASSHLKKELAIQLELALPSGHHDETTTEARSLLRLERNSAASRPFLEHNQVLTDWIHLPWVRSMEEQLCRAFICHFHQVERTLIRRGELTLAEWTEVGSNGSYRDILSRLLCEDNHLYRQVLSFDALSKDEYQELLSLLSVALLPAQGSLQ